MAISDRIQGSLEQWGKLWAAPLHGFLESVIGAGMEAFADALGKKQALLIGDLLKRVQGTGKVPPEVQKYLDELANPTGESAGPAPALSLRRLSAAPSAALSMPSCCPWRILPIK